MQHRSFPALLRLAGVLVLASGATVAPALAAATAPKAGADSKNEIKRHPLRGVVVRVDAEAAKVMVKHEAIPGVMRAMTMLFKVDAAVAQTLKPGQAITALMSRQGSDWVLENVQVAAGS